jgi:hypothetical protein
MRPAGASLQRAARAPGTGRWARVCRAASELTPDAIEQIAQRVAQLLRHDTGDAPRARQTSGLMDAAQLARHLGVTRAWIYQHAAELGAIRVGTGPRARLRFDAATVAAALDEHTPRPAPIVAKARTAGASRSAPVALLPIRPRRVRAIVSQLGGHRRSRRW